MSDQKYVELEEIEELYSRLGITEKDIIHTTDASDANFFIWRRRYICQKMG